MNWQLKPHFKILELESAQKKSPHSGLKIFFFFLQFFHFIFPMLQAPDHLSRLFDLFAGLLSSTVLSVKVVLSNAQDHRQLNTQK